LTGVVAITAGPGVSFTVTAGGAVIRFGLNLERRIGSGAAPEDHLPTPDSALADGIERIVTGGGFRLALKTDGTVLSWGANTFGQLGDGTTGMDGGLRERWAPRPVAGLRNVTALAAGDHHALALLSDGSVMAWGMNGLGQLGDGAAENRANPTPVSKLTAGIQAIAAGTCCSFALGNDGTVFAWGWNHDGQLGFLDSVEVWPVPVPVLGIGDDVVAVDVRCALKAGGELVVWGGVESIDVSGMEAGVRLGATKVGGRPDLPEGVSWPVLNGRPASFVAQVDLREVGPVDESGTLPKEGHLYFFCGEGDDNASAVLFGEPGATLRRAEFPPELSDRARYFPVVLQAERDLTLVPCESSLLTPAGLNEHEEAAYRDLLTDETQGKQRHRMLGHPDVVQNDSRPKSEEWILLLQVDSDDATGMSWGDSGRLYFWIRHDDMKRRKFENSWMDFQCY